MPASPPKPSLYAKLRHWLRQFASLPEPAEFDYPFARSDIAMLHQVEGDPAQLDGQTWEEMLLDDYHAQLAAQTSIVGQQRLHQRLAGGTADAASRARIAALLAAPAQQAVLERAMQPLRTADMEVAALLCGAPPPAVPWWSRWLLLPTVALLLSLLAAWLVAPLAWAVAVPVWLLLMALQMRFYDLCKPWERSVFTLQQILLVHGRLGALDTAFTAQLREGGRAAGVINRQITPLRWIKMIPLLSEYDDWLMLGNIRRYFHSLRVVRRERAFLRQSFLLLADLEADLALARHLRGRAQFCWAQDAGARQLSFEAMVHPLLDGAVPLSLYLDGRGAFISGQNAIGKSTLLRGVGLNLISARAFGFCYAQAASVPLLPLYSSMQNEDTFDGGESLYIAELRRARELLALAEGAAPALFLIDEIFRGTNHLESVAAAAAVLHTLAARNLVIVSSHNLVLGPLLEDCLAPWCVRRDDAGVLLLAPGVLQATNGIALLAQRGFGSAIEAKAGQVFDWLSTHMAQPADCGGVLEGA
ncbi:DNA mismatch repair protein MutS [Janthinobacterium sp. GW458P]|uniref:MutS-related protein n=1 Tax=Janthinobacterium sp. GW458P TaxID=1981504 RepID=UPI000A329EE5|nr:DNA mismatch repair protein MutS [Janthinobacterium sp. GW458P]MBE3028443.1 DNA mismatch repair protein MutS [Janthinobacterium sp. GW458P]